jgi:hypothetical protein
MAFRTAFDGVELGIAEYSAREYDGANDEFYWIEKQVMVVMDGGGSLLEVLPGTDALSDLINAVHARVIRVPDMVERLLQAKAG